MPQLENQSGEEDKAKEELGNRSGDKKENAQKATAGRGGLLDSCPLLHCSAGSRCSSAIQGSEFSQKMSGLILLVPESQRAKSLKRSRFACCN